MKLGIGSYLFRWAIGNDIFQPEHPMDAVGLIEAAHKLGVCLVQFADNLPLDNYDRDALAKVKETAKRLGVTLEAGTAGATVEKLLRHLEIAQEIGAKLVRLSIHHGQVHPTFEEALQVLRTVLPEFQKAGISIAIENHFTLSSHDLVSLVAQVNSPLVGICVDTANSIRQKEWPEETVKMLAPYALSLHLKDYKLETHPDHLGVYVTGSLLGEGIQDVGGVLQALKDADKDVNIILELWKPLEETAEETLKQEYEAIKKSIAFARKFLKE